MRILFVIPYFFPAESFGGPVRVAYDIGKELVKRGHEVVVYTSDANDLMRRLYTVNEHDLGGIKVCYFKNLSMIPVKYSKFFITPDLFHHLKDELRTFDIIHAHEFSTFQNILVHYFATKYNVPYLIQPHGSLPKIGRHYRKILFDVAFGSKLLKDASSVIALSDVEVNQCRVAGVPLQKIKIIPNGINLSDYQALPPKGLFRKKVGVKDNEFLILFLGRIHKVKGLDILVKAFSLVMASQTNAKLVIVGPDDGFIVELKGLISSLHLNDKIVLVTPLYGEDKLEAYVDADVYVLPSRYETFPMSALEAIACGTPVILSANCGIAKFFDGKVGVIVESTPVALSNKILELLKNDEERIRFSLNSKLFIQSFNLPIITSVLEKVYNSVLSEKFYSNY